ncbi:hypothetical protein WJX77_007008 [Trebouxia sp. C0004]
MQQTTTRDWSQCSARLTTTSSRCLVPRLQSGLQSLLRVVILMTWTQRSQGDLHRRHRRNQEDDWKKKRLAAVKRLNKVNTGGRQTQPQSWTLQYYMLEWHEHIAEGLAEVVPSKLPKRQEGNAQIRICQLAEKNSSFWISISCE